MVAQKAAGKRKVSTPPKMNRTPWFTPEVKDITAEKQKAFLKF